MSKNLFCLILLLSVPINSCAHITLDTRLGDPILLAQKAFLFVEVSHINVCLEAKDCTPSFVQLSGSGFLVNHERNGMFAITAAHSCDAPFKDALTSIQVTSYEGHKKEAYVVDSLPQFDICILYIPKMEGVALHIADEPPLVGDPVFTISAPLGIFSAGASLLFKGYYSGNMSNGIAGYTIPSAAGSSGSPILNEDGEVIGMTSAKMLRFENFCISPSYDSIKIIHEAIDHIK